MKFLGTKLTVLDVVGIVAIWILCIFLLSGCSLNNSSQVDMDDLQKISNCYCESKENVYIAMYSKKLDLIQVFCKDGSRLSIENASSIYLGSCLEKK